MLVHVFPHLQLYLRRDCLNSSESEWVFDVARQTCLYGGAPPTVNFTLQELPLFATTTTRHPNDLTNRRQDEAQPENLKEPLPQGLLVNPHRTPPYVPAQWWMERVKSTNTLHRAAPSPRALRPGNSPLILLLSFESSGACGTKLGKSILLLVKAF